ncbi:unnamed protein product [Lactuca virosa]|uniref:Zinc finger GRF-type domain-containing protein n=1 Tax=Lactuca virosa TaxID=75947 RepID=A0AAU9MCJ1_9ASTR|nr:unnamed protein product [Lactuca virosa]
MASSSSFSNSSAYRSARQVRRRCDCDEPVSMWNSWKPKNPRRRFLGFPNYKDKEKDCKFFEWIDPPLPNNWYKQMIYDFHNQGIHGVNVEEFEDFMDEDVEEVVQQIPLQVEGGMVVRGCKIWCFVGLIAIVWVMVM